MVALTVEFGSNYMLPKFYLLIMEHSNLEGTHKDH